MKRRAGGYDLSSTTCVSSMNTPQTSEFGAFFTGDKAGGTTSRGAAKHYAKHRAGAWQSRSPSILRWERVASKVQSLLVPGGHHGSVVLLAWWWPSQSQWPPQVATTVALQNLTLAVATSRPRLLVCGEYLSSRVTSAWRWPPRAPQLLIPACSHSLALTVTASWPPQPSSGHLNTGSHITTAATHAPWPPRSQWQPPQLRGHLKTLVATSSRWPLIRGSGSYLSPRGHFDSSGR